MSKTRILIVDDHALVRMGLAALLDCQDDLCVVGEAEDGESALDLLPRLKPDIVTVDLLMPGMGGVETTRRIVAARPETKVLVLTSYGNSDELRQAVEAGASGTLLKDQDNEEVVNAIRTLAAGGAVFQPERMPTSSVELTARQLAVLRSVTRGLTNPDIARQFGISVDGVKGHLRAIFAKIGAANRSEAVAIALRKHLLKV